MNKSGRWVGKSWATLGDSISAAGGYQPLVCAEVCFATMVNLAVSGCSMAAGGDRDYGATVHAGRALQDIPDCVTVFAGTNDFRLDKPLGSIEGRDIHTFRGAYATLIEDLLTRRPDSRLNLWTPLQRDKDGWDNTVRNGAGFRLAEYAEAIRGLGVYYALPVLDLYAESGITRLTLDYFTLDGLHPNAAGFQRIAGLAVPFLERL
ncbi:SGNH/GDSL hydrolase family protein [Paenibacillus sp. LMG 31459]|uniref:SGNH/GDSL hydrolase family protein n=1 Tax=Paenibacillus phytohabitans TaxID=2654978 RepID=A0ABX1YQW4_9BACL|nr:SGNH/GDSL hydrolase family protein [Paenibacillus phytohabitans]NOU82276.1 SGNH/GDSL hydrolase family protein [Paenibacillus phytohabitans]